MSIAIHEYILITKALEVEAVGSEDTPAFHSYHHRPTFVIGESQLLLVVKGGGAVLLPVVLNLFLFAAGNQHVTKGWSLGHCKS